MTQKALENHLPQIISDENPAIIELSLKDIAPIAGGPQVTNDEITPPPAAAPLRS